jgi:hypothetical protein
MEYNSKLKESMTPRNLSGHSDRLSDKYFGRYSDGYSNENKSFINELIILKSTMNKLKSQLSELKSEFNECKTHFYVLF